jgi:hypothetical protein
MLLSVVRVYQQGRKLSEAELRSAVGVVGDVSITSCKPKMEDPCGRRSVFLLWRLAFALASLVDAQHGLHFWSAYTCDNAQIRQGIRRSLVWYASPLAAAPE